MFAEFMILIIDQIEITFFHKYLLNVNCEWCSVLRSLDEEKHPGKRMLYRFLGESEVLIHLNIIRSFWVSSAS